MNASLSGARVRCLVEFSVVAMHNVHMQDRLHSVTGIVIWNSIYTYFHMNGSQPLAHSYRWPFSIYDSKKKKQQQRRSPNRSFNWYILHFGLTSKNTAHTNCCCCCCFCHCLMRSYRVKWFFPLFGHVDLCQMLLLFHHFSAPFAIQLHRVFLLSFHLLSDGDLVCYHEFVSNSSFRRFTAFANVQKWMGAECGFF